MDSSSRDSSRDEVGTIVLSHHHWACTRDHVPRATLSVVPCGNVRHCTSGHLCRRRWDAKVLLHASHSWQDMQSPISRTRNLSRGSMLSMWVRCNLETRPPRKARGRLQVCFHPIIHSYFSRLYPSQGEGHAILGQVHSRRKHLPEKHSCSH